MAFRQFVSAPLAAQTLGAQTVKLQIRGYERLANNNMFVAMGMRVLSPTGAVRGTVLAVTRDATELPAGTTLTASALARGLTPLSG